MNFNVPQLQWKNSIRLQIFLLNSEIFFPKNNSTVSSSILIIHEINICQLKARKCIYLPTMLNVNILNQIEKSDRRS